MELKPEITRESSGAYQLFSKVEINKPIEMVFDFFSNPKNLELMTPSFLNFKIIDLPSLPLKEGALITYKLKVRGLPLKWTTLISKFDPPEMFEDIQLKGPYKMWEHQHRFIDCGHSTIMEDCVRYKVYGGWLINKLFVEKDVSNIFKHRSEFLKKHFD